MSNYIFAPSPSFGVSEHPFVTYANAFNDEEIKLLTGQLDLLEQEVGVLGDGKSQEEIRSSSVSWVELTPTTQWLYDRMAWVARLLNGQFYKFDLYGFNEHMQYTVYDGKKNDHYTWHQDSGVMGGSNSPRKFSLILQLSDPSDYVGGDIEIYSNPQPGLVDKQKGLIVAFPSYTLHRVTPVTHGLRKTLVVWACGPSFK